MHKLLIVPDDLLKLALRDSFLDRRGLRIRGSISGEEALAIALVWHPSLIVFGSVLSDMTAATFVGRLRASLPNPIPQLIMVTTSVGEQAPELHEDLYNAHLVAPVNPYQLLDTAATLLELRQRRWPRVRAAITVSLQGMLEPPSDDPKTMATTIDLSEGGMRVEPREPLAVGSQGTATLVLPGSQNKLVLDCTVRVLVDEMQLHYGLEFTNPSEVQRSMLRAFVQLRLPKSEWNR